MLFVDEKNIWQKYHFDCISIYHTRSLQFSKVERLARLLLNLKRQKSLEKRIVSVLKNWATASSGFFGLIGQIDGVSFGIVDKTASHPIFYTSENGRAHIGNCPQKLVQALHSRSVNVDGQLCFYLSGYTLGSQTLFSSLHRLVPGEIILCDQKYSISKFSYHQFLNVQKKTTSNTSQLVTLLKDTTLNALEKLIDRANDRQILIPLSAGFDSRLIVSALSKIGARNVICFSYGKEIILRRKQLQKLLRDLGSNGFCANKRRRAT